MIGGTYTAFLSQARASLSLVALATVVWIAALLGASIKIFLPGRFDRFAVRLYLTLGWSAIFAIKPLAEALPTDTLARIVAGGVAYSIGVAFFLWESSQVSDRDLARLRRRRRRLPVRRRAHRHRALTGASFFCEL